MNNAIRVLVIDDSALVRDILTQGLNADPQIVVVGTASDPYMARDKIIELRPDVLTLDIEMPRMNGVDFLRRLMPQYPMPVVMVSALTEKGKKITFDALEAGAVDFVSKPKADISRQLNAMMDELRTKVKVASTANVSSWKDNRSRQVQGKDLASFKNAGERIIAVGASTGGTEAIKSLISSFPPQMPGVVIVQHMPPGFTRLFAQRLNSLCHLEVFEARDMDDIIPGRVLIAPGGNHLLIQKANARYIARVQAGTLVNGHCPSVDVLFDSVARHAGSSAIGAVLTGMGSDGAAGLLQMRRAGARCFAQDQSSCTVFGMPRAAFELGGVEELLPLSEMASVITAVLAGKKRSQPCQE